MIRGWLQHHIVLQQLVILGYVFKVLFSESSQIHYRYIYFTRFVSDISPPKKRRLENVFRKKKNTQKNPRVSGFPKRIQRFVVSSGKSLRVQCLDFTNALPIKFKLMACLFLRQRLCQFLGLAPVLNSRSYRRDFLFALLVTSHIPQNMSPRATEEAGVIEGQFLKALIRLKSLTDFIVYACSVPMVSNNHSHFVHA